MREVPREAAASRGTSRISHLAAVSVSYRPRFFAALLRLPPPAPRPPWPLRLPPPPRVPPPPPPARPPLPRLVAARPAVPPRFFAALFLPALPRPAPAWAPPRPPFEPPRAALRVPPVPPVLPRRVPPAALFFAE